MDVRDVKLPLLAVALDFRVLDAREARAFQKALNGGVGRADAGAFLLFDAILLLGGHADDMQRQAARRGEGLRAFVEQIGFGERAGHEALKILRRLALHARGDFFGEEFEQEIGHG